MPRPSQTLHDLLTERTTGDIGDDIAPLCAAVAARVSSANERPLNMATIRPELVADLVKGPKRLAELCAVRHTVASVLRDCGWSYQRIATKLHRDHSSIIHSVREVERRPELKKIADEVSRELHG